MLRFNSQDIYMYKGLRLSKMQKKSEVKQHRASVDGVCIPKPI